PSSLGRYASSKLRPTRRSPADHRDGSRLLVVLDAGALLGQDALEQLILFRTLDQPEPPACALQQFLLVLGAEIAREDLDLRGRATRQEQGDELAHGRQLLALEAVDALPEAHEATARRAVHHQRHAELPAGALQPVDEGVDRADVVANVGIERDVGADGVRALWPAIVADLEVRDTVQLRLLGQYLAHALARLDG